MHVFTMPSLSPSSAFIARIKELEQRHCADLLHESDRMRMKNDGYSWHYRPSHHASAGLIIEPDITLLSQPGKRMLSVGAHPGMFERLLCHLGVPAKNICVADAVAFAVDFPLQALRFDMLAPWPEIGTFDRIIFPESLCIALSDALKDSPVDRTKAFATDALEALLLADVLTQAMERLRPDGIIRADGPQSHPNVVKAARAILDKRGVSHRLEYERYFLEVARG